MRLSWIIIFLFFPLIGFSQLTSTHLPIVIVETENGAPIFDDPKREAEIKIIHNGEGNLNRPSDPPNEYQGKIGIEVRGESSQSFPKKSYLFETWDSLGQDIDTSFLNFPPEEDFILYAPFTDKSLLNNVLSMKIGNEMGRYASRTRFVELILNGDYQGIYVIMEKIKRDKNRVDIANLRAEDLAGDDVTGGYIIRIDKGIYQGWESQYNVYDANKKLYFQYYYPDQNNIRTEQKVYIKSYMDRFEEAIASPNYYNSEGRRYTDYINLRSFVDNFIINELSKNVDAYRLSTYFTKDKNSNGGRLVAGPLWDFNLSFGNADYCGGDQILGWEYYQCPGASPFWWDKMLKDDFFKNALRCRWESLRSDILATDVIHDYIDEQTMELGDAVQRNYDRWPILGEYVWPNAWYFAQANTYEEIINIMKERYEDRAVWLDLNIPGTAIDCDVYDTFDDQPVSIPYLPTDDLSVFVFPNPVRDLLTIESDYPIKKFRILNIMGQVIMNRSTSESVLQVNIGENLEKGSYFVLVETSHGIHHKQIVVQ